MERVHVNGKWLSQSLTGTQRYASELVRHLVASDALDLVLHVPRTAAIPDWALSPRVEIRTVPFGGHLFEQIYLPVATAGRLLLNFAGPAPLLKRRQLVTMHDATPFRFSETFRRDFVASFYLMYFILGRTALQLQTVSNFSADELADVLGVPAHRFMVVECAADGLREIAPAPYLKAQDFSAYLMVGNLAKHKNLSAPVAAITGSGRAVVIVGAAGDAQVFSATSPLPDKANLAGRLSDAQLVWLYQHSPALVFPSKYEGFGIPVLEAQTLRSPVCVRRPRHFPRSPVTERSISIPMMSTTCSTNSTNSKTRTG